MVAAASDALQDPCLQYVLLAAAAENEAIQLDRAGQSTAALTKYEESEQHFGNAVSSAAPEHAADQPLLAKHREQILLRIRHLKSLHGEPSTVRVEDHIKTIQLGMQAMETVQKLQEHGERASQVAHERGGTTAVAGATGVGAVAGLVALGPLGALAGAALGIYAATRQDGVGDTARSVGQQGAAVAHGAAEFNREHKVVERTVDGLSTAARAAQKVNEEHHVTDRVVEAGTAAVGTVQQVNREYRVSERVVGGIGAALTKAGEIDREHRVSQKIGQGLSAGLSAITAALSPRTQAGAAPASAGPAVVSSPGLC